MSNLFKLAQISLKKIRKIELLFDFILTNNSREQKRSTKGRFLLKENMLSSSFSINDLNRPIQG